MILAIDGGKSVGWAVFALDGEEVSRGTMPQERFFAEGVFSLDDWGTLWFESFDISQLVVEGIRHNPDIKQGGSQRWESQVEGAVRMLGAVTGIPVEVQPASILGAAKRQNGYVMPTTKTGNVKHLPDDDAAWLHGRYFLVAKGIID